MKCLTQLEIASWLDAQCVTSEPYGNHNAPAHCLQFKRPANAVANSELIRQFLNATSGEVLVHIADWPAYKPAEMAVADALRRQHNETRNLIDAPGHLFAPSESELAIAIFGHTANYEWNAYLYTPNDMATLYNWEGELYDCWTNDPATHLAVQTLVDSFGVALEGAG
jgi:hypothetical protein